MSEDAVIEAPEGEQTEAPAKEPLSVEELNKRLSAATRDMRDYRREISSLREMIQMRPALAADIKADEAEPDLDADPIGWMKYAKKELDQFKGNAAQQAAQERQQAENNAAMGQIARRMEDYERDFRDEHPDYNEAVKHFRTVREEELTESGVTPGEMSGALQQDLVSIVARAIRANKDPAEVVYKLAKNRGFGVDASTKKLQTIEAAAKAGKSLSQGGGRTGDGELTFDYVSSLKGKDFTEAFQKLKAQAKAAERAAR